MVGAGIADLAPSFRGSESWRCLSGFGQRLAYRIVDVCHGDVDGIDRADAPPAGGGQIVGDGLLHGGERVVRHFGRWLVRFLWEHRLFAFRFGAGGAGSGVRSPSWQRAVASSCRTALVSFSDWQSGRLGRWELNLWRVV